MHTPCLISGGSRWQGTKLVGGKRRTQSWPTSDPEAFTKADSFCQGSDVRVDDLFGPQPGATAAGGSNRLAAEAVSLSLSLYSLSSLSLFSLFRSVPDSYPDSHPIQTRNRRVKQGSCLTESMVVAMS